MSEAQKTDAPVSAGPTPSEELSPEQIRRRARGAQLRALVLSWHTTETYLNVLQAQATEIQSGELDISDDWGDIADSILSQFERAREQAEEADGG